MADKKISALTASTTPLAGTEVLPIVQGGSTVKVSIANVTAGRAVSTGALSVATADITLDNAYALKGKLVAGSAVGMIKRNSADEVAIDEDGYGAKIGFGGRYNFAGGGDFTVGVGNLVIGTTAKGITTGSAIPLGFGVNNTVTAITIDTSSNVGVGTASPSAKFNVVNTGSNSRIAIGDTAVNTYSTLLMYGGSGRFNFQLSVQNNVSDAFEITPSTAAGGTTFSTPAVVITSIGNVGVGTNSPAATAILDVQSTTKGVRFPNMTTTQKNAITPSAGTVIFDTTLAKLCVYSGSAWQTITSI